MLDMVDETALRLEESASCLRRGVLGEKDRAAYVVEGEPCVLKEDQADRTVGVRAAGTEHYQDR